MRLIRIEPGTFRMGTPPAEVGREAQETLHTLTIERPFWLGEREVTQAEWMRVMGTNPSHFAARDRPVERVSWHDVQDFLRRLNAMTAGGFRLPTEAEWEYACRAGTSTPFNTGATLDATQANIAANIEDSIAGKGATKPAGSFPPNAWGLFDMHGNVWEWTADDHCPYPQAGHPVPSCAASLKVIRGGSWYYEADSARCGLRYTHRPQDSGFSLGFRVARDDAGALPRDAAPVVQR